MKKLIILLLFSIQLFSQDEIIENSIGKKESYSFYIRIPNRNNLPIILSKSLKGVVLKHKNFKIESIFGKYKIYEFIQAFPTAKKQSLNETYLIKVNNIKLITELKKSFPEIYTFSEQFDDTPIFFSENIDNVLVTPDDYSLEVNQTDLDLINAQQAWGYTTGSSNVKLGIVDTEFNISHDELDGTISVTGISSYSPHGTSVAFNLAGNTNNSIGLASIGNNSFIEARTANPGSINDLVNKTDLLSQSGINIINGSWGNPSFNINHKDTFERITSAGVICVFSAGNTSNNTKTHYPAGYDNIISVTSIHHKDFMQPAYDENGNYIGDVLRKKDTHDNSWVKEQKKDGSHNHTYEVDIAAPGYDVPTTSIWSSSGYGTANGTSHAAPIVTGTIGLMIDINSSLTPTEVETILKLTSANIYHIPENANYIDKLGAGRLDAGKAVKMAYNMVQPTGIVEVKDRDFYRNWLYKLENAPYGIKIENEIFRDSIKVDFTARDYIEIENTTLNPNSLGFAELSIDPSTPLPTSSKGIEKKNSIVTINTSLFNNREFTLKYFLKNQVREDLDLKNPNDSNDETSRGIPNIIFSLNPNSEYLDAELNGFCNVSSATFKIGGSYLDVLQRGSTTLTDCGIDESSDFFKPITGNIYMHNPAKKVYYEFNEDYSGLWLWTNENHKLYFESKTLNTKADIFEKSITIYPNPSNDIINITLPFGRFTSLTEIALIDNQGKIIVKKKDNFETIDISKYSSGIYFLKLTNKNGTTAFKKIIKE